jgi:hypothetical protein
VSGAAQSLAVAVEQASVEADIGRHVVDDDLQPALAVDVIAK